MCLQVPPHKCWFHHATGNNTVTSIERDTTGHHHHAKLINGFVNNLGARNADAQFMWKREICTPRKNAVPRQDNSHKHWATLGKFLIWAHWRLYRDILTCSVQCYTLPHIHLSPSYNSRISCRPLLTTYCFSCVKRLECPYRKGWREPVWAKNKIAGLKRCTQKRNL